MPHSNAIEWRHVSTCSSTQDLARQIWEEGTMGVLVITADEQTAGRGTWGRPWWSSSGNLLMSVCFARGSHIESLPKEVALYIREWLSELGGEVELRGVNDLILKSVTHRYGEDFGTVIARKDFLQEPVPGKVCGILAEAWEGKRGRAVTLGIGLNCAQHCAAELIGQPIASLQAHGLIVSSREACREILKRIQSLFGPHLILPDSPSELPRFNTNCSE